MSDAAPDAESPQLLLRLLEHLGRGVRSTRALQEALGAELPTVQAALHAAAWLGFTEDDHTLSPLGLAWVYEPRTRGKTYARAVWAQPVAAELLAAAGGRAPSLDAIARALAATPTSGPGAALRKRAVAVRGLLAPVVGRARPKTSTGAERQLDLPLAPPPTTAPVPRLDVGAGGRDHNPDVYRFLLSALLDYGELTLGQFRALLDRAGADAIPIGGYVDLALARGDAARLSERLVATPDAVRRRELVETTSSLVLSDPGYRAYLADAVAAPTDRFAAARRDLAAARYRAWDRRLLGRPLDLATLTADLDRVLLDRPLSSFPIAVRSGWEPRPQSAPFLDVWDSPEVSVAAPQFLAQLAGGLPAVNRLLKNIRQHSEVALPDLTHRPAAVHAGLLHPGEPVPRSVPDARSLRLRAVLHSPAFAWLTAALLLHRQRPEALDVVRGKTGWGVRWRGEARGGLLATFDDFGDDLGWVVVRRPTRGLRDETLLDVAEALGLASVVGRRVVLAERFFQHLTTEPEEGEAFARLVPLAEAIERFLDRTAAEPSVPG